MFENSPKNVIGTFKPKCFSFKNQIFYLIFYRQFFQIFEFSRQKKRGIQTILTFEESCNHVHWTNRWQVTPCHILHTVKSFNSVVCLFLFDRISANLGHVSSFSTQLEDVGHKSPSVFFLSKLLGKANSSHHSTIQRGVQKIKNYF